MKISVLLPKTSMGGAEKLHFNLLNDWIQQGLDVELVVLLDLPLDEEDQEAFSLLHPDCKVTTFNQKKLRSCVLPLIQYFKSYDGNVILSPMWPLTCISIFAWLFSGTKAKLFISEHTNLTASHEHETNSNLWLLRFSMILLYRLATGIIAVSDGVKNDVANLALLRKSQIDVIYNPVATELGACSIEKISEYQKNYWDSAYSIRILGVGTLKEQKNFSLLIKAFSFLSSEIRDRSQLIILGDGPLRLSLLSEIESYGLEKQIFLKGNVLDTYPWYASSSLFVLSSSWEGFGNVLVEALECGIPIVSTDCKSGPSEILENGKFGTLVPVNDHHALQNAIEIVLNMEHDSQILKTRAQDFSIKKISREYLNYFSARIDV